MTPAQLKKARLMLGLSQEKLATDLGVTRKTVNTWEAGRCRLPRLIELAIKQLRHEYFRNQVDAPCPKSTDIAGAGTEMKSKPARIVFVVRGEMGEQGIEFSWASVALVLPQLRVAHKSHSNPSSVTRPAIPSSAETSDSEITD